MVEQDQKVLTYNVILAIIFLVCVLSAKAIVILPYFIPVVIVASVLIFLFAFTYFDWALVLLIVAMLLSPEINVGAASGSQNIVIRVEDLMIAVFCLVWLARHAIRHQKKVLIKTPINKFITLYILAFTFSTVLGMVTSARLAPKQGFFFILKYFEYFVLFHIVMTLIKDKKQIKFFLKAFLLTFFIVNIYGFSQIGSGVRISAPFEGEVGEPNTLGGYQVLLLAVTIGLLTHIRNYKTKMILSFLAVITLIPLAYTLSRASYMSLLPMYAILIFYNKTKQRNMLIGILIVVTICSIFFFPANIKNRIVDAFTPQYQENIPTVKFFGVSLGPSASARFNDWIRLVDKWQQKPFLGYGVTGVGFVDGQYIRNLVELGAFGLTAFIALLVSIYRNVLKIYKKTQDEFLKGLALGFLSGHVGMIFHAFTANTFILIRIMEPYWFLLAMVMMIPKIDSSLQQEKKEEELEPKIMLPRYSSMVMGNS